VSGEVAQALAEGLERLEFSQASTSTPSTDSGSFTMSSSEGPPESWITSFCSLMGHEYFAEVSEDFIEDDFNLTGLQSQVPMYKEALEMILDVEPEDDEEEDEEEDEDDDEDVPLGEEKPLGYRRAGDRKHMRVASDLSVIESSAELLYGLIHQRYITSRPGIQQMLEKYEVDHFGVCPRVNCNGCKVLPVGRTDTPGQETVKLFCPSCYDIYTPPNSRFQSVDGAFFGTTFGCLFFMTFPELDVGGDRAESILSPASLSASLAAQSRSPSLNSSIALTAASTEQAPNQPAQINGMLTSNFALGLGAGKIYEPRIYGFRVSERAKSGPRMQWLRMKPRDINELDESAIYYALNGADEEEEYHDGDTEMGSAPAGSQQSVIDMRRKAPMRKRRHIPPSNPDRTTANGEGG
jgi:casein kinase II subunit beta